MGHLSIFSFLAISARKIFFYDILDRKNAAFWTLLNFIFVDYTARFFIQRIK